MIDELAKILCKLDDGDFWTEISEADRDCYRYMARAVLTRLREPSEGMKEAAVRELSDATIEDPRAAAWDALRAFRAMIDAALAE